MTVHYNAQKTHCAKGHEYTPENTYLRPDGGRACRICRNGWNRTPKRTDVAYWKNARLRSKYGITLGQFDAMYAEQQGVCAICRDNEAVAVDHNHGTGEVRALLCIPCNAGLGSFAEDEARLQAAIDYVRKHG